MGGYPPKSCLGGIPGGLGGLLGGLLGGFLGGLLGGFLGGYYITINYVLLCSEVIVYQWKTYVVYTKNY